MSKLYSRVPVQKTKIFALILLLAAACATHAQTSVLFIGNSYTASNGLPQVFQDLVHASGDSVSIDYYAPGGYTFQMHAQDPNTISKIYQQEWDFVIFQAQSQEPSLSPAYVAANVYPYAEQLDSMVHDGNPCGRTVFYMTWGRKYGDSYNCASYPPVCTYAGMQQRLRESYLQMGYDNNAIVAPVGIAWQNTIAQSPAFDLYVSDNSHPSAYGTYLTACVFYATIFRESPAGIPYYYALQPSEAQLLQNVAGSTVLDSMSVWNTNIYYPALSWSVTQSGQNYTFINTSTNTGPVSWNFGSGFITQDTVQQTFAGPGSYPFIMTGSNSCFTDTLYDTLHLNPLFTEENEPATIQVLLSPNPARKSVSVALSSPVSNSLLELFDANGRLVIKKEITGPSYLLELNGLAPGIYVLSVSSPGKTISRQRLAVISY